MPKPKMPNTFDLLMEIAQSCETWHSHDYAPYADVDIEGVRRTFLLEDLEFENWLSQQLWQRHKVSPSPQALKQCISTLTGKARYKSPKHQVWLRVGQHEGDVYLDLTNDQGQVVQITAEGWQVMPSQDCPIRFARNCNQRPLPVPQPGGDRDLLWQLLRIDPVDRPLLLAWLGFCLIPTGPKPILVLTAPKGAGKSCLARLLQALVDPYKGGLLGGVGDERSLAVAAKSRWLLAFDNQTSLRIQQQDALCRVATGAAFSTRQLYSDLGEVVVEYLRPQILTSVDMVPTRSDLLDRCLLIGLTPIPEAERQPEQVLQRWVTEALPFILGHVLDLVVAYLRNHDALKCPLPRMADFAVFGIASETAMGLGSGEFMSAYQANIEQSREEAVTANPTAKAILDLLETQTAINLPATQLVSRLKAVSPDVQVQRLSPSALGKLLGGSLKEDLRQVGVEVAFNRSGTERLWFITRN